MRLFICTIGYEEYALTPQDGIALMQALAQARKVKQPSYDVPYEFVGGEDASGIVTEMRLAEVMEPPPPSPPRLPADPLATTHQPFSLAAPEMPF